MSIRKRTPKHENIPESMGRFCLWAIPVCYLIYSLLILQWAGSHSYSEIVKWCSVHWPDGFEGGYMTTYCLTPAWYDWVRAHLSILFPGILLVLGVYLGFTRRVWRWTEMLSRESGRVKPR